MFITATDLLTVEAIIGYGAIVNFQEDPFGFSLCAIVENVCDKPISYKRTYTHVETGALKVLGKDFLFADFAEKARYCFEKYIKNRNKKEVTV